MVQLRKMFGVLTVGLAFVQAAVAAPPAESGAGETPPDQSAPVDPLERLQQVIEQTIAAAEPAVVSIAVIRPDPAGQVGVDLDPGSLPLELQARMSDPSRRDYLPGNFGSGIVIAPVGSRSRYVLTNLHVVRGGPISGRPAPTDGTELRLHFASRRVCSATIRAADPRSDLAVLEPNWQELGIQPSAVPALAWRNAPQVRKGQIVITLGNPYNIARDGSASAAWGIVSNTLRRPVAPSLSVGPSLADAKEGTWLADLHALMQLDTRLNLGSSGGPVLNLKGEAVGLVTSLAAVEGYEKAGGLALPFTPGIQRIIGELLDGHEAEYGLLGISEFDDVAPADLPRLPDRPAGAVFVRNVPRTSPSYAAGLQGGDYVLKVGDSRILNKADLMREVGLAGPGNDVEVLVWRPSQSKELTLRVKLAKWPVVDASNVVETVPRYPPWRGLQVDYATARSALLSPDGISLGGVLIMSVRPGTPAQEAQLDSGLKIIQVNRIPVSSPAEFHAAVRSLAGNVSLTLIDGRTVTLSE